MDWSLYGLMLLLALALAVGAWLVSLLRDDVSHVDSLWSLFFLAIAGAWYVLSGAAGARATLVLVLVALWSLRLSAYITWRNHGQPEDHRYQEIRRNNEPNFRFKSLYIVFGLQALLAWFIAMPLVVAMNDPAPLRSLDAAALALWAIGLYFEAVGDAQLARFKARAANRGKVLDSGLWRYTRHPNYFGEFTLWWGYYLFAVSAGGWWTIASPLVMSFLLLRVSGVTLLEKDISERRPAYADYVRRTSAFFPLPPRPRAGGESN
jgi:steroid 5-alpha reductase family enzyme